MRLTSAIIHLYNKHSVARFDRLALATNHQCARSYMRQGEVDSTDNQAQHNVRRVTGYICHGRRF